MCPALHKTPVSATHKVDSHTVKTCRKLPLKRPSPKPPPCIVKDKAPVKAILARLTKLKADRDKDIAKVKLPPPASEDPTLTEIPRLPPKEDVPRHATELAEYHRVASHPVADILAPRVCCDRPSPEPCKVMLRLPEDAAFILQTELIATRPNETAKLTLPETPPEDTETPRLRRPPRPASPRSDESEVHSLASAPLAASLVMTLYLLKPSPEPTIVRPTLPVAATLRTISVLTLVLDIEKLSVALPSRHPAVADKRRLLYRPLATIHLTELSDTHSVDSH